MPGSTRTIHIKPKMQVTVIKPGLRILEKAMIQSVLVGVLKAKQIPFPTPILAG